MKKERDGKIKREEWKRRRGVRTRRDVHTERGSTSSGKRGTPSVLKRRSLREGEGRTDRPGGG